MFQKFLYSILIKFLGYCYGIACYISNQIGVAFYLVSLKNKRLEQKEQDVIVLKESQFNGYDSIDSHNIGNVYDNTEEVIAQIQSRYYIQ